MNIRVENWNGFEIRFVEVSSNEWWAVAKDVAEALNYRIAPHMLRLVNVDDKNTIRLTDTKQRGNPRVAIISEFGIYDAIWGSKRPEAEDFKKWVRKLLKSLRETNGLEGFQIFRMLDKEHQKEAMLRLRDSMRDPVRVDFIKANTIANKAVSSLYGHPKMIKKEQMTPEMLVSRQDVLDDTVNLMSMSDKFRLDIPISRTIYGKYLGDEQRNRKAN